MTNTTTLALFFFAFFMLACGGSTTLPAPEDDRSSDADADAQTDAEDMCGDSGSSSGGPSNEFACGEHQCELGVEYCETITEDSCSGQCVPIPQTCQSPEPCDCIEATYEQRCVLSCQGNGQALGVAVRIELDDACGT